MIASKDTLEPKSSDYVMPNSQRVYVEGEIHPEVRVPFREISLAPTKDFNGQLEPNEPVRVYDCSGPWGDPAIRRRLKQRPSGLRARMDPRARGRRRLRRPRDQTAGQRLPHARPRRIRQQGRAPIASSISRRAKRKPLRASAGHPVTQLWYARQGIITPEMEFIAIRENHRTRKIATEDTQNVRNGDSDFAIHPSHVILRTGTHSPTNIPANPSAHRSRRNHPRVRPLRSRRAAAPSSRPTSTIPSSSR